MPIREYRKGDADGIADLWRRNPSEEFPLLGLNPDRVADVLRRSEGPGFRFILGLSRLVGRPLIIVLVADMDGSVRGSTMLGFSRESGYVSGVTVDAAVRRSGNARSMLRQCESLAKRYHRSYLVLDVLSQNTPALTLYDSLGYRTLRDLFWLARDVGPTAPQPFAGTGTRIRLFRKGDAKSLSDLENRQIPDRIRKITPRHRQEFLMPAMARRMLKADSEAWVVADGGRPVAFVRAVVRPVFEVANLSPILLPDNLPESAGRELVATALQWVEARKAPRAVATVPDYQVKSRSILEAMGFAEKFRIHTMARPVGP